MLPRETDNMCDRLWVLLAGDFHEAGSCSSSCGRMALCIESQARVSHGKGSIVSALVPRQNDCLAALHYHHDDVPCSGTFVLTQLPDQSTTPVSPQRRFKSLARYLPQL
jgi:hypothetical protein